MGMKRCRLPWANRVPAATLLVLVFAMRSQAETIRLVKQFDPYSIEFAEQAEPTPSRGRIPFAYADVWGEGNFAYIGSFVRARGFDPLRCIGVESTPGRRRAGPRPRLGFCIAVASPA